MPDPECSTCRGLGGYPKCPDCQNVGGSDQRLVRRWPVNGEECVIWHRGTHLWATWYDREGLSGGPGAWIYTRNGGFVAFHNQVDRWWSLADAAAIRPPIDEMTSRRK